MLNNIPFDEIKLNALKDLIKDEVMEGRQLDYKRELNLFSKEEKREFLKDVTALANSSGGYLIYGVKEGDDDETKGFPVEVCGFAPPDGVEQHIGKMENLIRDGVERPLHGYRIKPVPTDSGQPALVMYVPSSWSKPHWVSLYGHRKFYIRHETVSSPLDFGGLQQLFTLSETAAERIRDFRAERIGRILSGSKPLSFSKPAPNLYFMSFPSAPVALWNSTTCQSFQIHWSTASLTTAKALLKKVFIPTIRCFVTGALSTSRVTSLKLTTGEFPSPTLK